MKVWIDPELCMGVGTCESIEPLVFHERGDGLWAVKESAAHFGTEVVFDGKRAPHGREGAARVPDELKDLVLEAAAACPGECIRVMFDEDPPVT